MPSPAGAGGEKEARPGSVAFAPVPDARVSVAFPRGGPSGDAAASASSASAGALQARVAAASTAARRARGCPASEARPSAFRPTAFSGRAPRETRGTRSATSHPERHARCAFVVLMRDASRAEDLNGPGATGREAPTSNAARIVATVVKKIDDDPASGGPQTGYSRARFRGLGARLGVDEEGQEALVLEHAPLRGREVRAAWCGAPDSHPSWTSKTARIFIVVGSRRECE